MAWLEFALPQIITVAAVLVAILYATNAKVARSRRRAQDLEFVAKHLNSHLEAMRVFVENPDAPADLRYKLLMFSKVVSDREIATDIVQQACAAGGAYEPAPESALVRITDDLAELASRDMALTKAFEKAVSSGIVAMFFRWAETADVFHETITRALPGGSQQTAIFATAVTQAANRERKSRNIPPEAIPA